MADITDAVELYHQAARGRLLGLSEALPSLAACSAQLQRHKYAHVHPSNICLSDIEVMLNEVRILADFSDSRNQR